MVHRMPWRSSVVTLLAAASALSCRESPSGVFEPDLLVSLSTVSVTVVQGASDSVVVNINRINFAGALALALDGAPAGTTVTFDPPSLPSTMAAAMFVLAVDASVTPGTYTLTLRVSGEGVDEHTAVLNLTVVEAPSFSISVTPPVLEVPQHATGTATVSITRAGGFTGSVNLTVAGAPDEVTAVPVPAIVTNATASVSITVGAANPGSYVLRVEGTATSIAARTATFRLDVTPAPDFSISIAPQQLSVPMFTAANATVTIARMHGFAGPVDLTVLGVPAEVSAVASPGSVTGSTALVEVTVGSAVPGSYPLTVQGAAPGLSTRTAELMLHVLPGNAPPVTVQFCGRDIPLWVGTRTAAGNWEQVTGTPDHRFSFTTGPRGAVAAVMPLDQGYGLTVIHATAAELTALGAASIADCVRPASGAKKLFGSVTGLDQTQFAMVALGDAMTAVPGGLTSSFTLEYAPDGASDLAAVRLGDQMFMTRLIIRRDVNYPHETTIPPLDFATGMYPEPDLGFIDNLGSDILTAVTSFRTAAGTSVPIWMESGRPHQGVYFGTAAVHTQDMRPGDMHEFVAVAQPEGITDRARGVACYAFNGGTFWNVDFVLGPALATPTITSVASAGYQRLRVEMPYQAAYNGSFASVFRQGSGSASRAVELYATRAYLGDPTADWDLTIPDLSAAGFNPSWGLASGPYSWSATASSSSRYLVGGVLPESQCDIAFAIRGDLSWTSSLTVSPRVTLGPRLPRAPRAWASVRRRSW